METRQKTEYKYYYLVLSNMHGGVDKAKPVIGSFELQTLIDFYNKEKEPWKDENETSDSYDNKHSWNKTFRKGSKLEWYNDLESIEPVESPSVFGGLGYTWIDTLQPNIYTI